MGYYVVKLFSEAYTLQEDTTCGGQIITAGELVVKAQYMKFMQDNQKWCWEQKQQQNNINVTTSTIVHTSLDARLLIPFLKFLLTQPKRDRNYKNCGN